MGGRFAMDTELSIELHPFTHDDMDRLISWIPSSRFLRQWAGAIFTYPLNHEQLRRHLAGSVGENPALLVYKAVSPEYGGSVGHGEIGGIDRENHSARIGRILVGPPELRGKGVGDQIVRALLRIAFEELSLHRVDVLAFDFNHPAIRCYERIGFRKEGLLRDARKHGDDYWSLWLLSILDHEFKHGSRAWSTSFS